jgi:hypothetical protein
MAAQQGWRRRLLAGAAGLAGATPKRGSGNRFSMLPPTSPRQCGETVFLTSREWWAATAASDDGVSRAGLAVIEGNLQCSCGDDDGTNEGDKTCRRSTRSWFGLGCGVAVRRWQRVELGFAVGIWWNRGSMGWLFIGGIDPGRTRHGLLAIPTESVSKSQRLKIRSKGENLCCEEHELGAP